MILLFSCSKKVQKTYFDDGKIKSEEVFLNDSTSFLKYFYHSGNVSEEGFIKITENDSLRYGHWKIFYDDRKLWWEGEIKNSVVQDNCKWKWVKCIYERFKGVEIKGNPEYLEVGKTYQFRVIIPDIHPRFYRIIDCYGNSVECPNDTFPYSFQCRGDYHDRNGNWFMIIFMNKDGVFLYSNGYDFFITPSKKNNLTKQEDIKLGGVTSYFEVRTWSDGTIDSVLIYK